MSDPAFWVTVAFFVFLALISRPVMRSVGKALDARAARIERELAEAVRLREEAQATLEAYQKKYEEIAEEAEEILDTARLEAKAIQKQAKDELERAVAARIALADEKIAQEEQKALQQVQKQVVELAVKAAKHIILEHLHKDADEAMIRLAIGNVNRIVH